MASGPVPVERIPCGDHDSIVQLFSFTKSRPSHRHVIPRRFGGVGQGTCTTRKRLHPVLITGRIEVFRSSSEEALRPSGVYFSVTGLACVGCNFALKSAR